MFEFIFGIFAIIVIVILAMFDSKRDHSDRYDTSSENSASLEPLLGVIYPEKDTTKQKDKNA